MAILTVGGTSVSIADESVDREEVPIGSLLVAFSGAVHSAVLGYKKRWKMKTILLPRATADTLEGLLQATPPLTLTGDITGSISGYASDISMYSKTMAGGAEYVVVSFSLWEA